MTKDNGGNKGSSPSDFSEKRISELMANKEYEAARHMLEEVLKINPSDSLRRELVRCQLTLDAELPRALDVLLAIENKSSTDFGNLAYVHWRLNSYDAALDAIEKCLLLKDSAWAHYFKSIAIRRGKHNYQVDEATKKQIRHELNTAITLPYCPEDAFLELGGISSFSEETAIYEKAIATYPHYEQIRTTLANCIIREAPGKAFSVLEPLLSKAEPTVIGLATQASIQESKFERALELLVSLPAEDRKKPGFSKIKGDLLIALNRADEAIVEFDREIASDHIQSQIVGLFSRSHINLKAKAYDDAIRDARNALRLCFQHGIFDFDTTPYWFPHLISYDYRHSILAVCKSLDINDSKILSLCEEETRWQGRFVEWVQSHRNEATEGKGRSIEEFAQHLSHPYISGLLSESFLAKGDHLEAIRHHLLFKRWEFSHMSRAERNNYFSPAFYLNDDSTLKKAETQKISRLIQIELEKCENEEEIRRIIVPIYENALRPALKKHKLFEETRTLTRTLLKSDPDNTDLLWDFAYACNGDYSGETAKETEHAYREYLKKVPNSAAACHNLSLQLERQGRMDEAWALVERAYQIDPKDKDYAKRFERFSDWVKLREKELLKSLEIKAITERTLARPVLFESLTLRQRLYLSTLLRCCLSEDRTNIVSVEESGSKLTPSESHTRQILQHLLNSNLIAVDPSSKSDAYVKADDGLRVYLTKVRWKLNVSSEGSLTQSEIMNRLCDPDLVPDSEIDEAIHLWREIALEESLEYLQHKRRSVNLFTEIGDKTREAFNELLNWFSTAQIYALIWSVVPRALADYEAGKFTSRTHAANAIPGRCKAYGEKIHVNKWNKHCYRRDFECPQSVISELLFNRYLMISQAGFDNRPGDFSATRLPVQLEELASDADLKAVQKDNV